MDFFDSIRLLALDAVTNPDGDATYRAICRWYSITFHTPLHVVEDLPQEDVLQAHFEHTYSEMSEEDRKETLAELLVTEEEKKVKKLAKDRADAEDYDFGQRMLEHERQKKAKAKIADVKETPRPSMLAPNTPKDLGLVAPAVAKAFEKIEPDVDIKFVDAASFEEALEGFGSMGEK